MKRIRTLWGALAAMAVQMLADGLTKLSPVLAPALPR